MCATPRTRSTVFHDNIISTGMNFHTDWSGSCTGPLTVTANTQSAVAPWSVSSHTKVMTDVVNDNFRKSVAKGMIFNNPMESTEIWYDCDYYSRTGSLYKESYGCTPKKWYLSQKTYYTSSDRGPMFQNEFLVPPVTSEDDLLRLKDLAVSSAHSKIGVDELLSLVSAAEAKKTAITVISSLDKLLKILRFMRSRYRFYELKKISFKDLSDLWLEARYGIRPIYYDVKGAIAALNADLKKRRQTFRGWASDSQTYNDSIENLVFSWNGASEYWKRNRFTVQDVDVRAGVLTTIDAINAFNVLGVDKIPETVFELIPFSFIVGWFFNVSDVIGSWTPNYGFRNLASWVVTTTTTTQIINASSRIVYPASTSSSCVYGDLSTAPTVQTKVTIHKKREPNPVRTIMPRLSINLDAAKIIDLALIGKNMWFGRRFNPGLQPIILKIEAIHRKKMRKYLLGRRS